METVLIAVVSLDGCLTRHDVEGARWASEADNRHFRTAIAQADVWVMGSATYTDARDTIRANLTAAHRRIIMTRSPERFAADAVPGHLEFTSDAPEVIVNRMRADGHRRFAVLGGGHIYNAFLGAGLVDEVQLTLEPRVFGTGTRLAGTDSPIDAALSLVKVDHLTADTLLLTYRRGAATASD